MCEKLVRQANRDLNPGDTVLLLGDIIDETDPEKIEVYTAWLDILFSDVDVLFVPGNHDSWIDISPPPERWLFCPGPKLLHRPKGVSRASTVPYMVTFPGCNYAGPSWAAHHPEEEFSFEPVIKLVENGSPVIVASHYPFWWANESADMRLDATMWTAGVKKVVFGHLHNPSSWEDACGESPLPGVDLFYVSAFGKEDPLTLVDWCDD
jgi:predicted phosphohydrolase